jgi:squalene-hopene/tetraprenyl-beta-curcumene cyclase
MRKHRWIASWAVAVALIGSLSWATVSQAAPTREEVVAKAINYLRTRQSEDGAFAKETGPAVTALVVTSLLRQGRTLNDPMVAKAIAYVEKFVQEDGGIYQVGSHHRNYETCVAVMAFSEANRDGRYDKVLKKADAFLKGLQWDEDEEKEKNDPAYGGAGYGSHKRPDLSNTSFLIEALKATGNDANSEALQKALIFVSRSQNLESEYNTTPFAGKVNDGGFYYTPAAGGSSQAGTLPNGGLRSYASMTYAGLKSMIYCGVSEDDPRVEAAISWIKQHYDLSSNPGLGDSGLYYYYHTFAKALHTLGVDTFVDANGNKHDWRDELVATLAARQKADGSWANENPRWMENNADLVTAYSLLALSYCGK